MALLTYQNVSTNTTSSGNVTVTKNTGLSVGDLMVAHFAATGNSCTMPSGFTTIYDTDSGGGNPVKSHIAWKIADSSDVAASDFTFTSTGLSCVGAILRFSNPNSTPIDGKNIFTGTASNTITVSTFTPDKINSIFVFFQANAVGATTSGYAMATDNPTWTEIYDIKPGSTTVASCAVSTTRTSSSATGNITATLSSSTSGACGQVISINPQITTSIISENISLTESLPNKTIRSFSDSLTGITDSQEYNTGRQWNKVTKPTTTWTNRPKN